MGERRIGGFGLCFVEGEKFSEGVIGKDRSRFAAEEGKGRYEWAITHSELRKPPSTPFRSSKKSETNIEADLVLDSFRPYLNIKWSCTVLSLIWILQR